MACAWWGACRAGAPLCGLDIVAPSLPLLHKMHAARSLPHHAVHLETWIRLVLIRIRLETHTCARTIMLSKSLHHMDESLTFLRFATLLQGA